MIIPRWWCFCVVNATTCRLICTCMSLARVSRPESCLRMRLIAGAQPLPATSSGRSSAVRMPCCCRCWASFAKVEAWSASLPPPVATSVAGMAAWTCSLRRLVMREWPSRMASVSCAKVEERRPSRTSCRCTGGGLLRQCVYTSCLQLCVQRVPDGVVGFDPLRCSVGVGNGKGVDPSAWVGW